MPSFDIVSEIDAHELANAVDQANREVSQRFDFKDTGAKFELKEFTVTLSAQVDFQLKQMLDIQKVGAALYHRVLDGVGEFPNISRPIVVIQESDGFR